MDTCWYQRMTCSERAQMAVDPIYEWARAAWDGLVSADDMRVAWRRAVVTIGLSQRPFGDVVGPAGAMVASARRLGW